MTTFTDGTPPSVTPGPDEGPGSRRRDRPADTGPEWLREEMQRRLAESRSSSGGRHARRDSAAGPATPVGYVPRHSVATPGPAAPAPRPVGGPGPAAGGGYRHPSAPAAWSGPPRTPGADDTPVTVWVRDAPVPFPQSPRRSDPAGRAQPRPGPRPADPGPTRPGPTDSGPTRMGPSDSGQTRMGPSDSGPTRMGPSNSGPTRMRPSDSGPTRLGPSDSGPTRFATPDPAQTSPGPTDAGPHRPRDTGSVPFAAVPGHPRPAPPLGSAPHGSTQTGATRIGTAQAGPAVEVPSPRRPEPGDSRATDLDDTDVQSRRVRVVLAERKGLARPVRTVVDIQEGTGVGALLRSNLIGSQLAVALRFALGAGLTLGLLPLLFAMVPAIGQVEVLGLRLPWLLLGVLVYPFLLGLGYWHTRTAERVEQDFADDVQG